MGRIADAVALMRGSSLAAIVAEIAKMEEAGKKPRVAGVMTDEEVEGFTEFWAKYPRHSSKPAAMKAYRAAIRKKKKHSDIMAGVERYVASRPDPQYIPHGSTFLNNDRFEEDFTPAAKQSKTSELRNDLRQRIENGQGGEDTGSFRRLAEREPHSGQPQGLLGRGR